MFNHLIISSANEYKTDNTLLNNLQVESVKNVNTTYNVINLSITADPSAMDNDFASNAGSEEEN